MESFGKAVAVLMALNVTCLLSAFLGLNGTIDIETSKNIVFATLFMTFAVLMYLYQPFPLYGVR